MKWIRIFDSKETALQSLESIEPFVVSINGIRVTFVKKGSRISAFKDRCPHAGANLSEGYINNEEEIVCPLHGYRFDLRDGREKTGKNCELHLYATDLREDGLFLRL